MVTSRLATRLVQRGLRQFGYQLQRVYPADYSPELIEIIERVRPYTMTSQERLAELCAAVDYIAKHELDGDIVECGVWRGGSMMAIALRLLQIGSEERDLYLFDTFAGMSQPTTEDVTKEGFDPTGVWSANRDGEVNRWCYASLDDVETSMHQTGYDMDRIHFVKGKVEETVPDEAPRRISVLRLDTDFYASTKHELQHLFPRLIPGGVLVLDDYGYWGGARKAVDEYLDAHAVRIMLHRTDASGRTAVKQLDA